MNDMETNLLKYLKEDELQKIQNTKIGIAGCGGIGSNTALNLVRTGFKNIVLVDFDKIEFSNLNRQFFFYNQIGLDKSATLKENLLLINPDLNIKSEVTAINKKNIHSIFSDCDIVVEGFDTVKNKKMLIEELHGKKPIVTASGLGDYWDVENIKIRSIDSNFTIIGDFKSDTERGKSPLAPGVSISSGKISAAVLKFTLGLKDV